MDSSRLEGQLIDTKGMMELHNHQRLLRLTG